MKEETYVIQKIRYRSDDGIVFYDKELCMIYESIRSDEEFFVVRFDPELNETGNYQRSLGIFVVSKNFREEIVRDYLVDIMEFNKCLVPGIQGIGMIPYFKISKGVHGNFEAANCKVAIFNPECIDIKSLQSDSNWRNFLPNINSYFIFDKCVFKELK